MKVGFTGTREGFTEQQLGAFRVWMGDRADSGQISEFHHGACVGADAGAVWAVHRTGPRIVAHPPDKGAMLSSDSLLASHETKAPRPYLDRNRDIVDASDVLLACPKGMAEEQRSGTWSTVRYARRQGKPVVIFWPDGTVTEESKPSTGSTPGVCP